MGISFLKQGADARKEVDKFEELISNKGPDRFWLKTGTNRTITFLDGVLMDSGLLQIVNCWEHNLKLAGNWGNIFACTQTEEPCPICQDGDSPYLAHFFTVMDHTVYTNNSGEVIKNQKKMFVAKPTTVKQLQPLASEHGGLRGCTFEVTRVGDKAPNVGDHFEFVTKIGKQQMMADYGLALEDVTPYNYAEEITCRSAADLASLGFGAGKVVQGGSSFSSPSTQSNYGGVPSGGADQPNYDAEL